MSEVIKSYKGFNKDMTCRDFQYKEGESYHTDTAECCRGGFHACEYTLDVFGYYAPAESTFHEVEQSGEMSRDSENSKVASTEIRIGGKIEIAGLVKAAIEYTKKRIKKEAGSDGDYGASSATGYKCSSVANDPCAIAVAWGYHGKAKGVIGSYIVLADWEGDEENYWTQDKWELRGAQMFRVDGEKVKADTWYTLVNGELKEVEENE